jgi:hypothetical protein
MTTPSEKFSHEAKELWACYENGRWDNGPGVFTTKQLAKVINMTKPSEKIPSWFRKWHWTKHQCDCETNRDPVFTAWLAYLEGRDARPVVVPEIIVRKGRFAAYRCPDCLQGAIGRGFNYCDGCGAKLDWSE